MYKKFENSNPYLGSFLINIDQLKQIESENPEIKIESIDNLSRFGYPSPFDYVVCQAISRISPKALDMYYYTIPNVAENVIKQFIDYVIETDLHSANESHIRVVHLSKTAYTSTILPKREEMFRVYSTKALEDDLHQTTGGLIYGFGLSKTEKDIYIFVNKDWGLNLLSERVFVYLLIARIFGKNKEIPKDLEQFINNLNNTIDSGKGAFKVTDPTIYETVCNKIKEAILKYIKGKPEYTIDKLKILKKLVSAAKNEALNIANNDLTQTYNDLNSALRNLEVIQAKYNELYERCQALSFTTATNVEEELKKFEAVFDFLTRSKVIKDYDVDDTGIVFTTKQPMYVNDKENFKRIVEKSDNLSNHLKKLLIETLVDEKYELYTSATMRMNIKHLKTQCDTDRIAENCVPHPHIVAYNCFGTYTSIIAQYITEGKYEDAIETMIEAAAGLNWADGPVTSKLFSYLKYNNLNTLCFRNPETDTWFSVANYKEEELRNETVETPETEANN